MSNKITQLHQNQQVIAQELLRKHIQQFTLLTPEEVELIISKSTIRAFKKGQVLLKQGETAKACYLVLKGCVRAFTIKDDDEKSIAFFTEGQPVNVFNSSATHVPSSINLVCVEDCLLTVGTQSAEDEMCMLIPRLESIIRKEVEVLSGIMQEDFRKFVTSSPEERYLNLLETQADLLHRVPLRHLASYLGIKPESLSRLRKRIQVKNTTALTA